MMRIRGGDQVRCNRLPIDRTWVSFASRDLKPFLCLGCGQNCNGFYHFEWVFPHNKGKQSQFYCCSEECADKAEDKWDSAFTEREVINRDTIDKLLEVRPTHQELFEIGGFELLNLFDGINCTCSHPLGNELCSNQATCVEHHIFYCFGYPDNSQVRNFQSKILRITDQIVAKRGTANNSSSSTASAASSSPTYSVSSSPPSQTSSNSSSSNSISSSPNYSSSSATNSSAETSSNSTIHGNQEVSNYQSSTSEENFSNSNKSPSNNGTKTELQENPKNPETTVGSTTASSQQPVSPKQIIDNSELPSISPKALKESSENQAKPLLSLTEQKEVVQQEIEQILTANPNLASVVDQVTKIGNWKEELNSYTLIEEVKVFQQKVASLLTKQQKQNLIVHQSLKREIATNQNNQPTKPNYIIFLVIGSFALLSIALLSVSYLKKRK